MVRVLFHRLHLPACAGLPSTTVPRFINEVRLVEARTVTVGKPHSGHTASPRSLATGGRFVNSTGMILGVWSRSKHDIVISVMFYVWGVSLQPGCVNKQR